MNAERSLVLTIHDQIERQVLQRILLSILDARLNPFPRLFKNSFPDKIH